MKVLHIVISSVVLVLLSGCSSLVSDKPVDYRAGATQAPKLEVPPDLTAPDIDDRYKVPLGDVASVATYSDYSKGGAGQSHGGAVLPEMQGVRLERDGARRWLVVNGKAENVWPVVKAFWHETGLSIKSEDQAAGVIETEWAENRAKNPQGANRNVLGEPFDNANSPGERDQYLTRLERSKDGMSTEVYITHRGIAEVSTEDKATTKWQARAVDPEMEAIMLQRLMVRFGASEVQAATAVTAVSGAATGSAPEPVGTSSLREISGGGTIIVVNDAFDRAWRRVGLAIESAGLAVEDKDREKGTYYLRPIKAQSSWADKLKFWNASEQAGKGFRVNVKDGGAACEVSVTDKDGAGDKVTKRLTEEIYKFINQ